MKHNPFVLIDMGHKAIFNGLSLGNRIDGWYGNGGVIYDFNDLNNFK